MTYNFDVDGTLVDFYGVDGWLEMLINEDTTPYEVAKPLISFSLFARLVNKALARGDTVNLITCASKDATPEFFARIEKVKRAYFKKHMPSVEFSNIFVIPYNAPKYEYAKGILFDDEERHREAWRKHNGTYSFDETDILNILKALL